MRRLNCAVQNYAWGKRGKDSMVSKLKMMENEGFETEEDKTYAELWMGTHPNGPSRVMPEPGDFSEGAEEGHAGIFLIELLETHPHYLGDLQEQGDLPFMFKVLSINKALSIQVSWLLVGFACCSTPAGATPLSLPPTSHHVRSLVQFLFYCMRARVCCAYTARYHGIHVL